MKILDAKPDLLTAARVMREQGMCYFDIALALGVSEDTISRWLGPGDRSKCKSAKKHGVHYVSGRRGGE